MKHRLTRFYCDEKTDLQTVEKSIVTLCEKQPHLYY